VANGRNEVSHLLNYLSRLSASLRKIFWADALTGPRTPSLIYQRTGSDRL